MVIRRVSSLGAVLGLLVLSGLAPGVSAAAGLAAPEQVIKETSDELQKVVRADRMRLKQNPRYVYAKANEIVGPRVDFSMVSSLVLGRHWGIATPQQKSAFSEQFKRLLIRSYAKAFLDFESWEVHFAPMKISPADNDVVVRTEVAHPGGPPIHVDYRMRRDAEGWKAYDVVIDGVSLVVNYRNQFREVLRAQGLDGLIRRIASLNERHEGSADVGSLMGPVRRAAA